MQPDVATVVGARPQFVKCALVSRLLRKTGLAEILIHTGQHYDDAMSAVFFNELQIPVPDFNLGIGSGSHGKQTGEALIRLEQIFLQHRPRLVLVYGDTNSTLAGALAAVKLGIPVAHVEAGLRSYNPTMPEEHNRIATDHWASLLYCHNEATRQRLVQEQVTGQVLIVGDIMRETLTAFRPLAIKDSPYPGILNLNPEDYAVLTVHRPVNADDADAMRAILTWCVNSPFPVVFPAHPRVHQAAAAIWAEIAPGSNHFHLIPPLGYRDMLALVAQAQIVLTDSGGLQKEAFFLHVPCVTLRAETEWVETVAAGWNILTGHRATEQIIDHAVRQMLARHSPDSRCLPDETVITTAFGPHDTSRRIVQTLLAFLDHRSLAA